MRKYVLEAAIIVFISILILAVYLQVKNFGLVAYDDQTSYSYFLHALQEQGLYKTLINPPINFPYWVPITFLTHITDSLLFGDSPGMHHLSSLFYHIITTLLIFYLFRKITKQLWPSAFIAVLFAVHPINVESVAFVIARSTVVSALFATLTVITYLLYTEQPHIRRYAAVLVCFAISLLAKPTIFYLPAILLLLDYWPLNRYQQKPPITQSTKQSLKITAKLSQPEGSSFAKLFVEKIPLLLLSVICLGGNAYFYTNSELSNISYFPKIDASIFYKLPSAPVSYVGYIWKTIWPSGLAWYVPIGPISMFPVWETAGSFLLLILITFIIIKYRQQQPYLLTGWGWFLIAIALPVIINTSQQNFIRDHYAYFPAVGLFIIVAWGGSALLDKIKFKKPIIIAISSVIIVTFTSLAWRQTTYWKSPFTLYQRALSLAPNSVLLHNNLGKVLYEHGEARKAIHHFRKALQYNPKLPQTLTNLGIAYYATGEKEKAKNSFKKAMDIDPEAILPGTKLAKIYVAEERYGAAAKIYQQLLAHRPDCTTSIYYNLACVYAMQNNKKKAIFWLKKSMENGFALTAMLLQDKDLENIRCTDYYQRLIKKIQTPSDS